MTKTERADGYYWVQTTGSPWIAEWASDVGKFFASGVSGTFDASELTVLAELVVFHPETLETLIAKIDATKLYWSLRTAGQRYYAQIGTDDGRFGPTPLAALLAAAKERGIG